MKLTFKLANKELEDVLAVSVSGKTKELTAQDKQISFNIPDIEEAIVQVEYKRNDLQQIKNPIGNFFAHLFLCLLSPILFFADNDNGIGIHKFFYGAKPFDWQMFFKIRPTENTVFLRYISPKYNKQTRSFSAPDVEILGAEAKEKTVTAAYNRATMKKEFRLYHYPAYTVIFAVTVALNIGMTTCLYRQFVPFHPAGVVGMTFCLLVVLTLLVVFICLFVSTHRLFRQIDRNAESRK